GDSDTGRGAGPGEGILVRNGDRDAVVAGQEVSVAAREGIVETTHRGGAVAAIAPVHDGGEGGVSSAGWIAERAGDAERGSGLCRGVWRVDGGHAHSWCHVVDGDVQAVGGEGVVLVRGRRGDGTADGAVGIGVRRRGGVAHHRLHVA